MVDLQTSVRDFAGRGVVAEALAGGSRRSAIEIPVIGAGEIVQQVWFPHYYVEKPLHYWGVEVVGNAAIATGKTPLASVVVRSWNTRVTPEGLTMYDGARVACVAAGNGLPTGIRFAFKVTFEGRAIVVPVTQ